MVSNIGPVGFLLIVIVALVLFGPNKLPQLGRALGRTLREFKEGTRELMKDDNDADDDKGSRNTGAARGQRNEVEAVFSEVNAEETTAHTSAPQRPKDSAQEKRLPD